MDAIEVKIWLPGGNEVVFKKDNLFMGHIVDKIYIGVNGVEVTLKNGANSWVEFFSGLPYMATGQIFILTTGNK